MESDVFDVIDEERRKEYHTILDDMIKYGFSRDMDTIFVYFRERFRSSPIFFRRNNYKTFTNPAQTKTKNKKFKIHKREKMKNNFSL